MDKQQEINQAIQDDFSITIFSRDLPVEWYISALAALHKASPISIGVTAVQMRELYNCLKTREPLTHFQFAIASNNLEARTIEDTGLKPDEYFDLMEMVGRIATEWNEETKERRDQIIGQVLGQPVPERPKNGLSAIKGEA
jgi:hypothetical protein